MIDTIKLEINETWHLHKPEKLIENDHVKILYDFNNRLCPWNHQSNITVVEKIKKRRKENTTSSMWLFQVIIMLRSMKLTSLSLEFEILIKSCMLSLIILPVIIKDGFLLTISYLEKIKLIFHKPKLLSNWNWYLNWNYK